MKTRLFVLSILLFCAFPGFAQDVPPFGEPVQIKEFKSDKLEEVSGMAFSHVHPNLMYMHTDSGGESAVYMFDTLGNELGKIELTGVNNRDWEDIAVGPGPDGKSYIYVAEIGDNLAVHDQIRIFRIPEPQSIEKESSVKPEVLKLTYPDGAKDAETLMVDPTNGELIIISKRNKKNTVYSISNEFFGSEEKELILCGELEFTGSVAGDIAMDGSKILVKSYLEVYYWERESGDSIWETLKKEPMKLPYIPEPQGEAIGFQQDGKAYFTISEKRFDILPILYRYPANF